MKPYLIALTVGLLVGIIYGLLNVRSPAPPIVALVGLFGILLGEQIVPYARSLIGRTPPPHLESAHHLLGPLPSARNCPPKEEQA
jgi:XapX domain-containing protein